MPAAFCTIVDLEQFLQIEIAPAASIDSADRAILEASVAIQNYCRQQIEKLEDDEITLDLAGGTRLFLPELPIVELSSVIEDGEVLVETDDYQLGQHGILHRIGQDWVKGIHIVTITYTHGYEPIPGDVVAICTRAAARAYQAGLKSAETGAVPGVTAIGLGDFSVSYGAEAGGGSGGVLGASAAPLLLRSEEKLLNRYRI